MRRKSLSTPSLGITRSKYGRSHSSFRGFQLPLSGSLPMTSGRGLSVSGSIFQLPLSGSHGDYVRHVRYYVTDFQLPLSGSQGPRRPAVSCVSNLSLSTPSLGITECPVCKIDVVAVNDTFNSLSRDHANPSEGKGRDAANLSTPSLGITEPDSGIFRLSAAFCRGTSSHK